MSGPKGFHVRVESAEERLRRKTGEARARCEDLVTRLEQFRFLGVQVRVPRSSGADLESLHAWEVALREAQATAEVIQHEKRAEQRRARLLDVIGSTAGTTQIRIGLNRESHASQHAEAERVSWGDRIDELVSLASQVDDDELHQAIADSARMLPGLPPPEAEAHWLSLRHRVASTVQESRELTRVRAEAADLVTRVAHLEGPTVDELADRAGRAATSNDLSELTQDIEAMVKDAERGADADFITREARAVLLEMGYEVDEPFEILGLEAQAFLARRRDLPDHALRVQVNDAHGTLLTNVVAKDETTLSADTAAEHATCDDALQMMELLAERGVRATRQFAREPGAVAVPQELAGASTMSRRRVRRRRRQVPRDREIGR